MITAPIIILIRPQMGENIGAVARAMSNFALSELRIVAPRDGWPNPKAVEMAAGGLEIINSAVVYTDFSSAMADINIAYATTARSRDMNKLVVSVETAMQEIYDSLSFAVCNQSSIFKAAIVFGPERTGIENEEITLCDSIITIPVDTKNPSLNLAQSSVIVGYEWFKKNAEPSDIQDKKEIVRGASDSPAPKADIVGLFGQLESYLDEAEYFRTESKKPIMWQNLKNMLLRGEWNEQEVRTFRGMLRSLWEYNNPSSKK